RRVHLRYAGTDTAVEVAMAGAQAMRAEFETRYRRLYSFLMDRPLVVEAVSVEAVLPATAQIPAATVPAGPAEAARHRLLVGGTWRDVPRRHREHLAVGAQVPGPAVVAEANATTVVDEGWCGVVGPGGELRLDRRDAPA